MATPDTVTLPAVGEQGEPCASCGAPLAADQRYCLNCGQRRTQVEYPGPPSAAGAEQAGSGGEGEQPPAGTNGSGGRDQSPLIAVGAIAVLGLMLLVGVLIGRGDGGTVTTAAPVAAPTTTTADESEQASAESANAGKDKGKSGKSGGKAKKSGGGGGAAPPPPEDAVALDDQALEDLNSASGKDQQEASANLPDTVAIPGEPPPKDNKEAGGGTKETVIK